MKGMFFLLGIITLINSCSTSRRNQLFDEKDCPYGGIQWMDVTDSTFNEIGIKAVSELNGTIKALSDLLSKNDSSKLLNLNINIRKARETAKNAKVSQAFYQTYIQKRITLCDIWTTIKIGNLSDSLKNQLHKRLVEISSDFETHSQSKQSNSGANIFLNTGPGTQVNSVNNYYNQKADSLDSVIKKIKERDNYFKTTPPLVGGMMMVDTNGITGYIVLLNEIPIEYTYRITDVEINNSFIHFKWPTLHPIIRSPEGIYNISKLGTFRFDQIKSTADSFKITFKIIYKSIGNSDFSIPGMEGVFDVSYIVNRKEKYYYDIRDRSGTLNKFM